MNGYHAMQGGLDDELGRFARFEREAEPIFGDLISAHVWLSKFSPRIRQGQATRRSLIWEGEKGLQEVLEELRQEAENNPIERIAGKKS